MGEFELPRMFYPGSEHQVGDRPQLPSKETSWDVNPVVFNVKGQPQEFFLVGHLAKALSRAPNTVRKWERAGIIPRAQYRTPAAHYKGSRRLYTREMVEGIVQIAREEGLLDEDYSKKGNRRPPANLAHTQFTSRTAALFSQLKSKS